MLRAPWKKQSMPADELANHVFSTYASVRYGMAAIAVAFPLVLFLGGHLEGVELQRSLSAYYWQAASGEYPPMRIWFVGILFVVGALLYLYKGFTPFENYALNVAGVCAFGAAIIPMPWNCQGQCPTLTLHGALAVVLFLCIAYVAVSRATDTLTLVADETLKTRYRRSYRTLGFFMVASPLTAFVATTLLTGNTTRYVFFIETAGIYAFAAYWWLKSRELARTNAELHAVHGTLEATAQGVLPTGAKSIH
jgi:hypothetical protein